MTVREFIQTILLEAPSLESTVYISKPIDDVESKSYVIETISDEGSNDSISIILKDY